MHKVSDGQRRRVQIAMGLLRPFKVLLKQDSCLALEAFPVTILSVNHFCNFRVTNTLFRILVMSRFLWLCALDIGTFSELCVWEAGLPTVLSESFLPHLSQTPTHSS